MKNMIFITGTGRSGTSMTAGIVAMCGAWGGRICGATPSNKRGQFENIPLRNGLTKPYLSSINCDPLGQYPLPDLSKIVFPDVAEWREKVYKILFNQGLRGDEHVWYYKAPKMCLIWPIWDAAFPEAKWIIVRRDKEEIANSCMRTGFMRKYCNPKDWEKWVEHFEECFKQMKEAKIKMKEVWPVNMIQGNFTEMKKVIEWCGLTWNDKKVLDFVEPALWHGRKKNVNKSN